MVIYMYFYLIIVQSLISCDIIVTLDVKHLHYAQYKKLTSKNIKMPLALI